MDKTLILKPHLSEQAYAMSQAHIYVFEVPASANKHTVSGAGSGQVEVEVKNVNISNIAGTAKRTIRKGGRISKGKASDIRKAYVTLKAGQSLPIFAAEEEAEAKEQATQEKLDKAAAKAAEKEAKPARRGLHLGKKEKEA